MRFIGVSVIKKHYCLFGDFSLFLTPAPGGLNDGSEISKLGAPVQDILGFAGTADQYRGVADTAVCFYTFDGTACYYFGCPNDLPHRKTVPVSEVEGIARAAAAQVIEGQGVGIG